MSEVFLSQSGEYNVKPSVALSLLLIRMPNLSGRILNSLKKLVIEKYSKITCHKYRIMINNNNHILKDYLDKY